jgi:hypothetical protein
MVPGGAKESHGTVKLRDRVSQNTVKPAFRDGGSVKIDCFGSRSVPR